MRVLHAWMIFCLNATHYLLFRVGLVRPPNFRNYPTHWEPWLGSLLGWPRTLRVVNPENCPKDSPAVFAGGHGKLDDPLFIWGAVHRASKAKIHIYFMMRDDFFVGPPWSRLPFSMNELTQMSGCIQISRDNVQLSQLKPLLAVLGEPGSFVMFPGRTRSRSGMLMEYRDGVDEPGGVSFFISNAQRRFPDRRVPAVPVVRTFNPVDGTSAVAFGPPQQLPDKPDREAQRNFDLELAVLLGDLLEIHALHLVSAILFLRCLHGNTGPVQASTMTDDLQAVVSRIGGRLLAPELASDPATAVTAALDWLAAQKLLQKEAADYRPDATRILKSPALETGYRKENPVRYHANQLLHLPDVLCAVEDQVCPAGGKR